MTKAKELKELLNSLEDEEDVRLAIRPAMNDSEEDTFSVEKVTYTVITYHSRMHRPSYTPDVRKKK